MNAVSSLSSGSLPPVDKFCRKDLVDQQNRIKPGECLRVSLLLILLPRQYDNNNIFSI